MFWSALCFYLGKWLHFFIFWRWRWLWCWQRWQYGWSNILAIVARWYIVQALHYLKYKPGGKLGITDRANALSPLGLSILSKNILDNLILLVLCCEMGSWIPHFFLSPCFADMHLFKVLWNAYWWSNLYAIVLPLHRQRMYAF